MPGPDKFITIVHKRTKRSTSFNACKESASYLTNALFGEQADMSYQRIQEIEKTVNVWASVFFGIQRKLRCREDILPTAALPE